LGARREVKLVREQIIEEIKRLAAENDGKAPGKELFANRTGIRKHEWLGKYWTRWSDALIDAGFSPNEFIKKLDKGCRPLPNLKCGGTKIRTFPILSHFWFSLKAKPT
jgi:hypothetical protein